MQKGAEGLQSSSALLPTSAGPGNSPAAVFRLAACSTAAYFLCYFLRYPIYMLPDEVALRPFATFGGKEMTMQEALTVAFGLGFGLAKFPAVKVMSSPLFFRNRFRLLAGLHVAAYLLLALPVALSDCDPLASTVGQFLSCFPQSWVYGGLVTYLEGRQCSETLFALMTASFIFAGSASRGTATAAIDAGLAPRLMPLVIGAAVLPLILLFLKLLDGSPLPSDEDRALRRPRTAMSAQDRRRFMLSYWPGIFLLVVGYCMLMSVRTARDLFNRDLVTAANHGVTPSPFVFGFLDVPGGAVAALATWAFVRVRRNRTALLAMLACMLAFLVLLLGSTFAFQAGWIQGVTWQVLMGVCIYGSFSFVTGSPLYDRLVSCSDTPGATCTFLLYLSDLCGYALTIVMPLWKVFFSSGQSSDLLLQQFLLVLLPAIIIAAACFLAAGSYFAWKFDPPRRQASVLGQSRPFD